MKNNKDELDRNIEQYKTKYPELFMPGNVDKLELQQAMSDAIIKRAEIMRQNEVSDSGNTKSSKGIFPFDR